jgi:hypothetical protein
VFGLVIGLVYLFFTFVIPNFDPEPNSNSNTNPNLNSNLRYGLVYVLSVETRSGMLFLIYDHTIGLGRERESVRERERES